ncbi:hypothetical protein LPB144_06045 [Christiangramia salexigens]|uniref:DinB-like domain-containing protein n=2 Tax=Christiangramia salexigens TaxID=1913577 RepID=A0A1L3J4G3_9FLAO|nr:hypothetical protein LPB144_06045 [Christiangramia salexigens]
MTEDNAQRAQLIKHLEGGLAFASIDSLLDKIPFEKLDIRPEGLPYSFYEVFFHICFAQKDILEYTISGDYQTRDWPDDYWPSKQAPADQKEWESMMADYFEDRRLLKDFIRDPNNDLNKGVVNSKENSLLREFLLVIEHTAYHTGQLVIIQRLLGVYDN